MADDEWMQSVRRRTHDLANRMVGFMEELIMLREQQSGLGRRVEELEKLTALVRRLEHESKVLRWLLGVVTAVVVAVLLRVL